MKNYKVIEMHALGEPGAYAWVCAASRIGEGRQTGPLVAKIFHSRMDKFVKKHFRNEVCALKRLAREMGQHPSLPGYETHHVSPRRSLIIMTRGPSDTLENHLCERGWPIEPARTVLGSLVHAVAYLHSLHLTHRDIKPQNVLYDRDTQRIMLIDFGFATDVSAAPIHPDACWHDFPGLTCAACGCGKLLATADGRLYKCTNCQFCETLCEDLVGSPLYFPLEMLQLAVDSDSHYFFSAMRADVFAVGLVGYLLVYGYEALPWVKTKTIRALYHSRRLHGVPVPHGHKDVDNRTELFLRGATADHAVDRPLLGTLFHR